MATKLKHLKCSMPNCNNTVGQHSTILNKSAQVCSAHRKQRKTEVDDFKLEKQCANQDGHYGFECVCKKITYAPTLDINHKDGDNGNRDESNIEILCKMCHTRVTNEQGHHLTPRPNRRVKFSEEAKGLFTGLTEYKHIVKKGKCKIKG